MRRSLIVLLLAVVVLPCACTSSYYDRIDPWTPTYRPYGERPLRQPRVLTEVELAAMRAKYVDILEQTLPMKDVAWQLAIPGAYITRVSLQGDAVYVETDSAATYAVDFNTGYCRWRFDFDRRLDFVPGYMTDTTSELTKQTAAVKEAEDQFANEKGKKEKDKSKLTAFSRKVEEARAALVSANDKDVVYVLAGNRLHCFDRVGGAHRWNKQLQYMPSSSVTGAAGYFFVTSVTGDRIHSYVVDSLEEFATYKCMGDICAPPVLEIPSVYFGSTDGLVYSYDVNGRLNWTYTTDGPIRAGLVCAANLVYACGTDYAVYAIDRVTGGIRWKFETGGPITEKPELCGGVLYVKSDDNALFALDAATGQMRWKVARAEKFACATKRRVYLLGSSGELLGVDPKTGDVKSRHPIGPFVHVVSNTQSPILLIATEDGFVFALAESDTKF
ncbi:MAG: PQQ-binding-like beta-propeller repeat protein [Planctomycetota bacterium]|nr:PQQ-binding-like beta-propeller repeat protein [Planctomycetota bacterium]